MGNLNENAKVIRFTCDHCGQIVENGLVNVTNHIFECKSAEIVKIDDTFSAKYYKPLSLTKINN